MVSVNEGLLPEIPANRRLDRESITGGRSATDDGEASSAEVGEGGCYRVHLAGESDLTASQSRLWRRLFRVLEDPLKPILLIDGGSISLFQVLQHVHEFSESGQLRAECNYVVAVPADGESRDELVGAVRQVVAEAELHGQCVDFLLDEYDAELPTMIRFVGRSGGAVLTGNRSLTDSPNGARLSYRLEPIAASEWFEPPRVGSARVGDRPGFSRSSPSKARSKAVEAR